MPVKSNREYRVFSAADLELRNLEDGSPSYIVEGYASTFKPYVMYELDGNKYSERIATTAFDEADMTDVIMQYDHEGRVYARQKNGTLEVTIDDNGLKIRADLSKTSNARNLYEDIAAGMINQMSFAFSVEDDHYEKETRTRVIDRVKRVYDVSAVSIPANPDTEISARSYFDGVIEMEQAERLAAETEAREKRKQKIKLLLEATK